MGAIIVWRTSLEYGHVQRGGPGPRGGLSAPADGAWQRSEVGVSWEPVPVHGAWQRPWTFIAAVAATVIGLGNVWKFSWLAGQHGGGGFVLAYLLCLLRVGVLLLIAGLVRGVRAPAEPVHAMAAVYV